MRDSMGGKAGQNKGVEARETVPDQACGKCKGFSENAYVSDGRGYCKILKTGSDISADPVVAVLAGDAGYITFFNADGGRCSRFEKMELMDTDGSECADPEYRRSQRQMEKLTR